MSTTSTELAISGMTCASCAGRIERKLNKLEGVVASVNYATELASVSHPSALSFDDLAATVAAAGYAASPKPVEAPSLLPRLLISTVLALPVLLLSMVDAWHFHGWSIVTLVLATPVVLWCGLPFHRAALVNARHGSTTMDTLVSLGTLSAWLWSLFAVVFGGQVYLEVASVVTAFLLAGRFAEDRAKGRAGAALRALLELGAKDVAVLRDGVESLRPVAELEVGDHFVVRPGEKVATDGVVVEGTSAIDASLLTGESVPVEVSPGSAVTGATVNAGGRLVVRAERVGADTQLAQIGRLVSAAQSGKAEVQRLADRVSAVFVPVVLGLALMTLAAWLVSRGSANDAFSAAVAVLIIACPCALGLATPTALLVGTGRGAQLGILLRGPQVLESTRRVDTVVLDKTGTVTTGVMTLHEVVGDPLARRLVGALESHSEHPVGRAIAVPGPPISHFASHAGLGVTGTVEGHEVVAGRPAFLVQQGISLPGHLADAVRSAEGQGRTAVVGGWDGLARAVFVVGDSVRPTSAAAVRELRALGLTPVLLTGDNATAARAVADEVGIEEVIAEVLPANKVAHVTRLQAEGRVVAVVGDGVNDAAALAQADLGLAMGTGTDVAMEASDLTLVRGDLRAVGDAIRLSRRTLATIKANLFWAFAYNVAAIPLAALGLLNPVIAGMAMALSSVFVVTNSLRLRRFR